MGNIYVENRHHTSIRFTLTWRI